MLDFDYFVRNDTFLILSVDIIIHEFLKECMFSKSVDSAYII